MTDFPDGIVIEARKAGLKQAKRKAADGSWFDVHDITFEIHPNDTNSPLSNMPLGTRVALVVTQLREDGAAEAPETEQPGAQPSSVPLKGGPRSKRAGIACGVPEFQRWRMGQETFFATAPEDREEWCAEHVRWRCGVQSRAELDHNEQAGLIWDQIERDYHAAMEGRTPAEQEAQRRAGP